jgi:chlorophyll synthase
MGQIWLMQRFLNDPIGQARFYSGFGVPLFVVGMMVSAFALRGLTEQLL